MKKKRTHFFIIILMFFCADLFGTNLFAEETFDLNKISQPPTSLFGKASTDQLLSSKLLSSTKAFHFFAEHTNKEQIALHWNISPGYYLYRDRFRFSASNENTTFASPTLPQGITKHDEELGDYQVITGDLLLTLKLPENVSYPLSLLVHYQGCAESGYCYPPVIKRVHITKKEISITDETLADASLSKTSISEQDRLKEIIKTSHLYTILPLFYFLGLLLAFTPCVLPLLPILSAVILGHRATMTTSKAFFLSLSYVLGMSVTYAAAGLIVGLLGTNLQAMLQQPSVLITTSIIIFLLAISQFGLFSIHLPAHWETKLDELSKKQHPGTYLGVVVMGAISALIVSPCVTPVLIGILGYISQTGNAGVGGLTLFVSALGMGTPLILVGVAGGKALPKAGPWMDFIKAIFGILLLGLGIWLLSRILPSFITLLFWGALSLGTSAYLLQIIKNNTLRLKYLWKTIVLLLFIYGLSLVIGAFSGGDSLTHPLHHLTTKTRQEKITTTFKTIRSISELNQQLNLAKEKNLPVFVDFYADWCISCKHLEQHVLSSSQVIPYFKKFYLIKADVTNFNAQTQALLEKFQLVGPPSFLFFDTAGREISQYRMVGEVSLEKFIEKISEFLSSYKDDS